jgi:hypothetical protein
MLLILKGWSKSVGKNVFKTPEQAKVQYVEGASYVTIDHIFVLWIYMNLSHELFIEIIQKMKLPVLDGVCHGFAMMLAQFICRGQEERFFYLLDKIKSFDSPESLLLAFDQDLAELSELKNFFEEIVRYQNPFEYQDLLGGYHLQQEIDIISNKLSARDPLLFPGLIKQIPLKVVYKKLFMLSRVELINYLDELQLLIENVPDLPMVIQLGNDLHKICIQYDLKTQKWANRDIAFIEKENYQYARHTTPKLADSIFMSLFDVEGAHAAGRHGYSGFSLSILVSYKHVSKIKASLGNIGSRVPDLEVQNRRTNSRAITLLQIAEITDCKEDFIKILAYGSTEPNVINYMGETPLHGACIHNSSAMVKALLSHPKTRPHCRDFEGFTPLDRACIGGFANVVKVLLKHKEVEVNEWDPFKQTPLHEACIKESLELVKALLAHQKIRPNERDVEGLSPLDYACIRGNINIVRELLAHPKTCSKIRGPAGMAPVEWARLYGYVEIEKLLLAHKKGFPHTVVPKIKSPIALVPCFFQKEKNKRNTEGKKSTIVKNFS